MLHMKIYEMSFDLQQFFNKDYLKLRKSGYLQTSNCFEFVPNAKNRPLG